MEKKFKYQEYLDRYTNCPAKDCIEGDFECFRWVHKEPAERDFLPVPFIRDVTPRKLSNNDEGCEYYNLSVYKDFESASKAYKSICEKATREAFVIKFRSNIGDFAAQLRINKNDGVSNAPDNRSGHISFYEYTDCNLLEKITCLFDIFA